MKRILSAMACTWFLIGAGFAQSQSEGERYFKIAWDYFQKGEYQKAIDNFTTCATYIPKGENIYFLRGQAKEQLGQYNDAVADFDMAISLKKDVPEFYNARAWAYCFTKKYVQATWDADKALGYKKAAEFYDTRATSYGLRLSVYNSINDFNEAIKLSPKPLYYYKRGLIKKVAYDTTGAEKDFAMAKKLDPGEAYKKESDPFYFVFTEQYFTARRNKTNTSPPAAKPNTGSSPLQLTRDNNWAKVDKCSVYFPGKPDITTSSNESFSLNYTAIYQQDDVIYFFHYAVVRDSKYEKVKDTDLLKNLREAYAKNWNAAISDISFFADNKLKVGTVYKLTKSDNYGMFIDGRDENKIYRIGIFNSRHYPTYEELKKFYNWFFIL